MHLAFPPRGVLFAAGKISRVLAAKLSLCVRVDALTEAAETAAVAAGAPSVEGAAQVPAEPTVAIACRRYVENKLEQLEQQLSGSKCLSVLFQACTR